MSEVVTKAGYDVYAICETHLTENNGISVPGYTWYGHNRTNINPNELRGSGGVGFLIANDLLQVYNVHVLDESYEGILWIRLVSKEDNDTGVLLCACYLPPEGSSRGNSAQEFYDTLLTQTYMYYDGTPMCYLGDFNGRIGDKQDFNSTIDDVTRRHAIDNTTNIYLIPDTLFQNERCRRCLLSVITSLEANIRCQRDIDSTYEELVSALHGEMSSELEFKDYTPGMKSRRKNSKPYWNNELKILWNQARDAEKDYLKYRGENTQRNTLRCRFLNIRTHFDKELRRAERTYNASLRDNIQQLCTGDPKGFWNAIKNLGPRVNKDTHVDKVMMDDGTVSSDPEYIMGKWKRDFETLYMQRNSPDDDDAEFVAAMEQRTAEWQAEYDAAIAGQGPRTDDIAEAYQASLQLNAAISLQETVNALKYCKNGKATGIDNIPNEILKIPALQETLHKLYSTCFETNLISSVWYKAIIHPILKRGKDPLFPLNHRGISLISTVAKVFSIIINTRLTTYIEIYGLYVEEQNGFRRMRSCLDHLFTLTTVIRNRKAHKQDTFCAFIDFEKAFDSVNYPFLWFKLAACGIQGKFLQVIQTMYQNLECSVRINGRMTDWFSQTAGVRQGDTLALTLFAIFINDLVPEINNLRCGVPINEDAMLSTLLYADDIVLISDTPDGLQNMLHTVNDWSSTWKLKVNEDKSKIVHFRRESEGQTQHSFIYGDTALEITPVYRYLGLELHETLDYTHSVKCLTTAAGRALGAVTNKYFTTNGLDYHTYTKLFSSMVCPIMDYGCEVWAGKKRDGCDVVQHRAMRTFLGVGKCTPLPMLYGDMAWVPSHVRQQAAVVRLWIRLTQMPRSRLARQVFEWDYSHARRGTWCYDMKKLFESCGMLDTYLNKCDDPSIIQRIHTSLHQADISQRRNDMTGMSRMSLYRDLADAPTF